METPSFQTQSDSKLSDFSKDPRTVFGYCRVSTDQQQNGLASQVLAVHNYFKRNSIEGYQIFQDENVSGSKTSRPALDQMMQQIAEGRCKMLVVFSFSRFSRSCSHLLQSMEFLKKHNTQLVSISEAVDTQSSVGQALLAVLGALAQLERDLIRERVIAGLTRARQCGKHIGRRKTRPSEVIRALLRSGLSLRACATIAKTSHGSVSLEKKIMKQEEQARIQAEKLKEQSEAKLEVLDESTPW